MLSTYLSLFLIFRSKGFSLVTDATDQQNGVTNLTVCIEDTTESYKFNLILIDQWGTTVKTSGILQGEDVLCFASITLSSTFDTSGRIRILVTADFMYSSFYGDGELYLLGKFITSARCKISEHHTYTLISSLQFQFQYYHVNSFLSLSLV